MSEITIKIASLLAIPLAYQKAIEIYKSDVNDQIWHHSIELIRIDFEGNYRRIDYNCIFKITESQPTNTRRVA